MQYVRHVAGRPDVWDMRDAGMGKQSVEAVVGGELDLINSKGFVQVEGDVAQVEVCTVCGHTGCETTGWVAMRKLASLVVWIPPFADMATDGNRLPTSYMPQGCCGAVWFSSEAWSEARAMVPVLPDASDLPPITSRELALVLQWDAPHQLLGHRSGAPCVDEDLLAALVMWRHDRARVDRLLRDWTQVERPVRILHVDEVKPAGFVVDTPGSPLWMPFVEVETGLAVIVDEASGLCVSV